MSINNMKARDTMKTIDVTSSFIQDQRHETKTDRFKPVQPSQFLSVMNNHGFDLVSLKTSQARKLENASHQTTIARYRSRDQFSVNRVHFDIILKIPHIYGSVVVQMGMFRLVCLNGLVVGSSFDMAKVRHTGNPIEELNNILPRLVAQREKLADQIKTMQSRNVTPVELAELSRKVADLRLNGTKAKNIQYADLLKVRRIEDKNNDLFSVLNVLQENVMRYGIRYETDTFDRQGVLTVRNMNARPVGRTVTGDVETSRSIELNASIYDLAADLLKVA